MHPLRIGIAGLGTVGVGVIKMLDTQGAMICARAGRDICVRAVSARSRDKDRGVSLSSYGWEDNPCDLAVRDDIDVFVELMGGTDGPAKQATQAALAAGKHVVTANKAMLAVHGHSLALLAEQKGRSIRYEAAVAGGIPIVKTLTEGLAGNKINRILGVMNGTCNYILTRMQSAGLAYEDVFKEAQALGYLEADPRLDVGGIDAGHKLAILSSIAYGSQVDFDGITIEGIERISIDDIRAAADLGFKIKLLGVSQATPDGLEQRMSPCLVPDTSPLGQLDGGTNMVVVEGSDVGQIVMRGAGAGRGPTASAVMGDIIDLARGVDIPVFGQAAVDLRQMKATQNTSQAAYYIRLTLKDKPGALACVTGILGDAGVSIDRMRQYAHKPDNAAQVLIVTHATTTPLMIDSAKAEFVNTDVLFDDPVILRIEDI